MASLAYRSLALVVIAACSSSSHDTTPDAGAPPPDASAPSPDASTQYTFSYTPSWSGVTSVEVIGDFGQTGDWTTPFVTLTANGDTFTGSATLTPGAHMYLFHVVGDADAGAAATKFSRYVFDPASPMFMVCPQASPTYSTEMNPCSVAQLGSAPVTQQHVTGKVVLDGAAIAGYLVVLEREEPGSHHFFVDRSTTAADGTYSFSAAPGNYRIQVQYPDIESSTDAAVDPAKMTTLRRSISTAFAVSADVTMADAELAFHDYAKLEPRTTAKLPTTFTLETATPSPKLDIYGTANHGAGDSIGDPWYASAAVTTGSAAFDGTFTTKQANETAVAIGERYFWGIERVTAADSAGVKWTQQSLVFPITWR
jgi:hypothetical protein